MAQGDWSGPNREGVSSQIGMDGVAGEPGRRGAGIDRLYSDFMGIIGGKKLEYVVRVGLRKRQKKTREERDKKKRPHRSTRSSLSLKTILTSERSLLVCKAQIFSSLKKGLRGFHATFGQVLSIHV